MEINIVSREIIKPSCTIHHLKPYNLCLFDQFTPVTYVSVVLFYRIADPKVDLTKTSTQLKKSLSETLTLYFPFSGRIKNNLYVDNFLAGVLFLEAQVKCGMPEFLEIKETELLNELVPFQPFRQEKTLDGPLVAFQFNVFSFGGIALGMSFCHKNADGATLSNFLNSWAAFCGGPSLDKLIYPNISDASILFPPMTNDFLEKYTSLMDRLWFKEGDYITRRFIFRPEAIETLKEKVKTENVPTPSRNVAVSCLIWKHAMVASWAASGSPRPSIASHAMNIRPRMKPRHGDNLLADATGNLFWWAMAVFDPNDEDLGYSTDVELSELVRQVKGSMEAFECDFLQEVMKGNKEGWNEVVNQLDFMCSVELEKPDVYAFTNWKDFYNDVDFGFGNPFWVGTMGKVGPAFRNLVILVDADQWGKGSVEAFITLERREMALLEHDSNFLAFTSQNAFSRT